MGFFNKFPYTDEHEINLDWILQKIENIKIKIKELEDAIHDIVVTIPNNGKLTLKRNNVIIGDFTADQATDEDINISVPENTSELNNDSGFVVSSDLATVATTGSYNDLLNKPTIPAAQVNSDWNAVSGVAQILNKPSLATVATSGSYNDLLNQPTIPAAQVNSDWNAISGVAQILNKPTIPTVNDATLTIQKNGTDVSTFTANASSNVTCNITCEDKVFWLTSDKWHYYRDSSGVYHLHYHAYASINYSGSIGNLKYRTTTYDIDLPVTLDTYYSITVSTLCASDVTGATIQSATASDIKLWLWAATSGAKATYIEVDVVSI